MTLIVLGTLTAIGAMLGLAIGAVGVRKASVATANSVEQIMDTATGQLQAIHEATLRAMTEAIRQSQRTGWRE